jgi:hypothetical protein
MKKQAVVSTEKSTEKTMKRLKDKLEKCAREKTERKVDPAELLSEKNRKSANVKNQVPAGKENIKKLSLAIATMYEANKVADKKMGTSSNKHSDAAGKKLFGGKFSSLLLHRPPISLINEEKLSKYPIEDKSPQNRPSTSHPRVKTRDEPRLEDDKPTLPRDKTVPKIGISEYPLNRPSASNFTKGSSIFKACINSINRKIDKLQPKDSKPKRQDKQIYLSSLTNLSGKVELLPATRTSKLSNRPLDKQLAPTVMHKPFKQAAYFDHLSNKENERSRVNQPFGFMSKAQISTKEQAMSIRRVTEPEDPFDTKSAHLPRTSQKTTTKTKPRLQISGEYNISEEHLGHNSKEPRSNCKPVISKFDEAFMTHSKLALRSSRNKENDRLPMRRVHGQKGREELSCKDPLCEDVLIDQSLDSSLRSVSVAATKGRGLKCDEQVIRVDLKKDESDEERPRSGGSSDSDASGQLETNELCDRDILRNLLQSEREYEFSPHYMDVKGCLLKWNMRAILLDWMIEVADDMGFKRSTYYYAANYLDRFLATKPDVTTKVLQLVGLTCLTLAAKLEEILVPALQEFSQVTLNTFSVEDIEKMEITILKVDESLQGVEVESESSYCIHLGELVHLPLGRLCRDQPLRSHSQTN